MIIPHGPAFTGPLILTGKGRRPFPIPHIPCANEFVINWEGPQALPYIVNPLRKTFVITVRGAPGPSN